MTLHISAFPAKGAPALLSVRDRLRLCRAPWSTRIHNKIGSPQNPPSLVDTASLHLTTDPCIPGTFRGEQLASPASASTSLVQLQSPPEKGLHIWHCPCLACSKQFGNLKYCTSSCPISEQVQDRQMHLSSKPKIMIIK